LNPSLYFNGRQIKNYLIGFASLFSEIPYMKRNGTIGIVPIVYGSPSDVISYLESNVDNLETKNRNRLKDLTIPLFSFRLTNLQKYRKKKSPTRNYYGGFKTFGIYNRLCFIISCSF
jgi:hypothetical protein